MDVPQFNEYFGPRHEVLVQGDLFLCPTSALVPGQADSALVAQVPPPLDAQADLGRAATYPLWSPPPTTSMVPHAAHLVRWGPVMVLSHECEMEKDFNGLVRFLTRNGMSESEATEQAGMREDADQWIVVAPLLTAAEIQEDWPHELRTPERLLDVQRGLRSGYFPVPAGNPAVPAGAVAINRTGVVSRQLLTDSRYLATLSESSRSVLRYKLARTLAYRDLSVQAELERAIGQRITAIDVQELPKKKNEKRQIEMVLHLDGGDVLQLQGSPLFS